jgi:hypothetical protein
MIYGARISLTVGLFGVAVSFTLGILIGDLFGLVEDSGDLGRHVTWPTPLPSTRGCLPSSVSTAGVQRPVQQGGQIMEIEKYTERPLVLSPRGLDCLPLEVGDGIGSAAGERHDVIFE